MRAKQQWIKNIDNIGIRRFPSVKQGFAYTGQRVLASAIAVDRSGSLLLAGDFKKRPFFDGDSCDAWLMKFSAVGSELWKRQFGSAKVDSCSAVAVDGASNIYAGGSTEGEIVAIGGNSAWIAKFSSDGTELWRRQFVDLYHCSEIAVDGAGNVYAEGVTVAGGGYSIWITKFSSDGTELWRRLFGNVSGSPDESVCSTLAVDGAGNVYVGGVTAGEMVAGESKGDHDAWIAKFSSDGAELWRRQFGTSEHNFCSALSVDGAGNIYALENTVLPGYPQNACLIKFSQDGAKLWRKSFNDQLVNDIVIDGLDNIYLIIDNPTKMENVIIEYDTILLKFSAGGYEIWRQQIKIGGMCSGKKIVADGIGNVYFWLLSKNDSHSDESHWLVKIFNEPETIAEMDELNRLRAQTLQLQLSGV